MEKRDITLVLGGGSALGLAHIGVIEELEKYYNIKAIIGTSMGAIVGGLYASGKSTQEMVKLVKNLSIIEYVGLLRFGFSGNGFLDSKWFEMYLKDKTHSMNIEDLDIEYAAISFDIKNLETVYISKGPLCSAMRASSSLPFVFEPFHSSDRVLIDGGVEHPLPLAFTKILSKRRPIIASNVLPEINKKPKVFEISDYSKSKDYKENYIYSSLQSGVYNQASMALSSVLHFKPFMYINAYTDKAKAWDFKAVELFYLHGKRSTKKAIRQQMDQSSIFEVLRKQFDNIISFSL